MRLRNFLTDTTRSTPAYDDLVTPEIGNATLFDHAAALHSGQLDNWTPPQGVSLIQIAGWGIPTTRSGITYKKEITQFCLNGSCSLPQEFLKEDVNATIDGDGTVVVPSALWTGANVGAVNYWVNLRSYNNEHWFATAGGKIPFKHANILEVKELRSFVTDMLASSTEPLATYAYLSTDPPFSTKHRLRYALHSPLTLDLYDNLGNHTGISTSTGEIETNILGTYYDEFGDVKYLYTDASTTSHIVMSGYATGTFTFNIDELKGNALVASTTFKNLPTTPSTEVTLDVQSDITTVSPMKIDINGDGTADITLAPKPNDIVTIPPPKLPLTITALNKTITLGAPIPPLTATLSGFASGDTATSSTSGTASCTTATIASTVGIYSITCTIGTLVSSKYDFTIFTTGTLTIQYKWSGFTQPINDTSYNPTQSASVFKGGSTVPVKFQLKNANGGVVQSSSAPLWLSPQKGSAMSAAIDESTYSDPGTSGTIFKWDSASQQYIYNWSTKGLAVGYWYKIFAKLEDGTIQSVVVGVR